MTLKYHAYICAIPLYSHLPCKMYSVTLISLN